MSGYGAHRSSMSMWRQWKCHTYQDNWQHTLCTGSAIQIEEHGSGALGDVVGHGPGQGRQALLAEHSGKVLFSVGSESAALALRKSDWKGW